MNNTYLSEKMTDLNSFESLPVYQLYYSKTSNPSERIYSQFQICNDENNIYFKIFCFETDDKNFPNITIELGKSKYSCKLGDSVKEKNFSTYTFFGEDLQGKFNGILFTIPYLNIQEYNFNIFRKGKEEAFVVEKPNQAKLILSKR